MMKTLVPWLGLLPLAWIIAFAVWQRMKRSHTPDRVLVAVGQRPKWTTRPPVIRTSDQLALVKNVGAEIERAGFTAKAVLFLGQPTMDLILEAQDPEQVVQHLASVLGNFPVVVRAVGRPDDLKWVSRLWRHM
jgi:hypothetical protein